VLERNFERNIGTLIINVLPSLTARKGHLGRERMAKAFTEYFAKKGHESASVLVKNRFKVCADYNLSLEDTARFEIGGVIAITVSTIPAAFWMLYYVFSKPEILALLREEVVSVLETTTNLDDTKGSLTRTLNITKLRTACPLLTSTFQETLRHGALGASVRLVVEDTIINGQYLLKKDCVVQIPTHVVHFDPSIWGTSVDDFDASRFVPGQTRARNTQGKQKKKAPPGALRPFGGGKNLCPGRHFAATEILALVSMILMRYELHVVTASDEHQHKDGEWAMPKSEKSSLAAVVREPDEDTEVEIRLRKGYEEGRWAFRLDDSELVFAIDDDE
jgi:cytochrome P450